LLLASTNPAVLAYDPAFAYEVATIVRDGLRRMMQENEDIFYYVSLYNEPQIQPEMPEGVEEGILAGLYPFKKSSNEARHRAQIFGSGSLMGEALRAQELLSKHHEVAADIWSAPSYHQLRVDGLETERWNRLHPDEPRRQPYVAQCLENAEGPVIAVSDSMKSVPDQIARWVPSPFVPLGTDGFGRSDTRAALRRHFEIDAEHIAVAALAALAEFGDVKPEAVADAIKRYEIDPERITPAFA
jgi:pyruvate dehydrogenase E1 component